METIERKSLLYRSGLGFWCINPVLGCAHRCAYPCYAFLMARQYGRVRDASEWGRPRLVKNALALLEKELTRKRQVDRVHLCLTTDPFMQGYPEVASLSLELIALVNRHGMPCSVLTKGRLPIELADENRFRRDNQYGFSLVSLDEDFCQRFEPGAAPFRERIAAARALCERGCSTRIHMEPYPTPNIHRQDLMAILKEVDFVEELFFGRWNYNTRLTGPGDSADFYRQQAALVGRFCQVHRIRYQGLV